MKRMILLIWILLGILVFFSSLATQIVVDKKIQETLNIVFPEGWAFFTKDPRDFSLKIYKINEDNLEYVDISNQSIKNLFGFSRSARLIGYEASTVVSEIKKEQWKESETKNLYKHIKDTAIVFENKKYFNHLKEGEYLIKLFKPIPFAWANKNQEKNNPFFVVKIRLL